MNASETAARAAGTPITGAEIVCRALAEEGVTKVFGYPGGAVIPIYDEIFKQSAFQHILTGHEQGAAHAADAYARATGKPGVLIVTSGPGATNAVTGISTAYSDSIPLIIISGQVGTSFIGTDAFQECDTVGITRPCVKHNFLVRHVEDLAKTIKEAFYIATTGRPGPVLIDIPKDIQLQKCVFDYPEKVDIPTYKPITRGHMGQIRKALNALLDSARPLILVGGGSIILPEKISGAATVLKPEHFGCANAIGSAISKVSGTYEKLMNYDELPREQSLEKAKNEAIELAVEAGAVRETVEIIEMEDVPLAYYPGNTNRVKIKAAGDLN